MPMLLQAPIVVEVVRQPPVTPEITITDVIVAALGTAGVLMLIAALGGLLVGGAFIYFKKRAAANTPVHETDHARLRI
jgi:hypothetical protein